MSGTSAAIPTDRLAFRAKRPAPDRKLRRRPAVSSISAPTKPANAKIAPSKTGSGLCLLRRICQDMRGCQTQPQVKALLPGAFPDIFTRPWRLPNAVTSDGPHCPAQIPRCICQDPRVAKFSCKCKLHRPAQFPQCTICQIMRGAERSRRRKHCHSAQFPRRICQTLGSPNGVASDRPHCPAQFLWYICQVMQDNKIQPQVQTSPLGAVSSMHLPSLGDCRM